LPDGPLADPGVRYSRTGLVRATHTQKGWGDHRSSAIHSSISKHQSPSSQIGLPLALRYIQNLDIFWLKDDALEDSANLPAPDVIASEIVDDLEAALEQFSYRYDSVSTCNWRPRIHLFLAVFVSPAAEGWFFFKLHQKRSSSFLDRHLRPDEAGEFLSARNRWCSRRRSHSTSNIAKCDAILRHRSLSNLPSCFSPEPPAPSAGVMCPSSFYRHERFRDTSQSGILSRTRPGNPRAETGKSGNLRTVGPLSAPSCDPQFMDRIGDAAGFCIDQG
jgi:hypothetical protein